MQSSTSASTLPTLVTQLRALGNPVRLRIVDTLRERATHVDDLVQTLHIPQPKVSTHLAILQRAGLVTCERRGEHGRRHVYRLCPDTLRPLAAEIIEIVSAA